jgi:tRNA modification GTPase
MKDTIFAPASGSGRAGIAVYRLSGPATASVIGGLTGAPMPPARRAVLRHIRAADGELIDQGLVLWFPGPASFTGEDVAELHLHGSRAVSTALTDCLVNFGLRPAEAGEFSRRAFEAGKMDLTQAEAIADLVAADTAAQRRQALRQLDGALGALYEGWRQRLLRAQAHLEAVIDFADEDLPDGAEIEARQTMEQVQWEITAHLADGHRGEKLRTGVRVALLGAPNAGKSSLFNCLLGRDAAIVSDGPGTTRDVIEIPLELAGLPALLVDTAGLRDSSEPVEKEGVRRARVQADTADIRVLVLDGARWPAEDAAGLVASPNLVLLNKVDLITGEPPDQFGGIPLLAISALTGQGLPRVRQALAALVAENCAPAAAPSLTRARHRVALQEAEQGLRRAQQETLLELVAEDVRGAVRAVGCITGRVDVEAMLDVVFREFCIGK